MSTKILLEAISTNCLSQLTKYRFNKQLDISDKYRAGKIASFEYVQELIYYFYERDAQLKQEFQDIIKTQVLDTHSLKDGDYKKGMGETLNWISKQIK